MGKIKSYLYYILKTKGFLKKKTKNKDYKHTLKFTNNRKASISHIREMKYFQLYHSKIWSQNFFMKSPKSQLTWRQFFMLFLSITICIIPFFIKKALTVNIHIQRSIHIYISLLLCHHLFHFLLFQCWWIFLVNILLKKIYS